MDWIFLIHDRDQLRALVNTLKNFAGFIKCWEIIEQLSDWRLLKKGLAEWS
jgi:hypothetical protein